MGGGKVEKIIKKAAETIEKVGKAMAEALAKNLEAAMEEVSALLSMGGDQVKQVFDAVKAVIVKHLSNLKSAVMKGAAKAQEAITAMLSECKSVIIGTVTAMGTVEPDAETIEQIVFHIAGAFLGGGGAQKKLLMLHEKAKEIRKKQEEACDKRIDDSRLKIIMNAPPPGISEEAIDGIICIVRDGGVTGDDKKYSNIWNLQKAAMRGQDALLREKDETAKKCIAFMATTSSADDFTQAQKEKIVEEVMVACLGPLGKAAKGAGCFKKKAPPPKQEEEEEQDETDAAAPTSA